MAPLSFLLTAVSLLLASVAGAPAPHAQTAAAAALQNLSVPISNPEAKDIIPNKYIVVYNETFEDEIVVAHQAKWAATLARRNIGKRSPVDNRALSPKVNTFSIGTVRAMAVEADDQSAVEINSADCVSFIEADAYVRLNALVTQTNATTGLARLSSAAPGATDYVFDDSAGQGITAFIVDTGIMANHTEFEDRATLAFNGVNNVDTDENGHGSHVAGTIGGATFGVAKKVNLVGVKVLDAQGAGSNSGVISGMQFGKHILIISWGLILRTRRPPPASPQPTPSSLYDLPRPRRRQN